MKTVNAIVIAALGLLGSASAFTIDFTAYPNGLPLNNNLVVFVPGYGNVIFTEGATPPTSLEISDQYTPFTGISFEDGEKLFVTFDGGPVTNIDFAFAGVGTGEEFITSDANVPDNGTRVICFSGTGAALIAMNFEAGPPVPEPSSTLLVVLGTLGLLGHRRR